MPFLAPPADTERAGLRGFLSQQLDGVRHTSYGLTEQQIRESPARSALCVGGLNQGFDLTDDDTLASLVAAFDEAASRILIVADTADLDALAPIPEAPWFPRDLDGWTVRWILLHVIEELARHAGHGDIVREQVDGATMYELIAAAEGMGDLGFVRPWTPQAE